MIRLRYGLSLVFPALLFFSCSARHIGLPASLPTPPPSNLTVTLTPFPQGTGQWATRITATTQGNYPISKIDLYEDGNPFATLSQPQGPFNFDFDTTSVTCGIHAFMARAYDLAGKAAWSESELLTVLPRTVLTFNPGASAGATVFVAWDMNPDGTVAPTGPGGNGNLGSSAQIGHQPPADPTVQVFLPDFNSHTININALDIDGYNMPGNPVAVFQVPAPNCGTTAHH